MAESAGDRRSLSEERISALKHYGTVFRPVFIPLLFRCHWKAERLIQILCGIKIVQIRQSMRELQIFVQKHEAVSDIIDAVSKYISCITAVDHAT